MHADYPRRLTTEFAALLLSFSMLATAATAQQPPVPPLDRFADPLKSPERVPFEEGDAFAIRPGEVIVLTGSANGVFEQQQGWLETLLAAHSKDAKPIFRNMCWEGDTVFEQWRAMNFGNWGEQFDAVNASTIVLWFGQIEALDDTKTIDDFRAAYSALLDEFAKTTPRLVIISPLPFEKPAGEHVRDNTSRNDKVKAFADVAQRLAAERKLLFVDIFTLSPLSQRAADAPKLTSNGLHLTPAGQREVSQLIAQQLGSSTAKWSDELEPLRKEIVYKNRLWFDCWRTMNWYFAYGDRTWTSFDKPSGGRPLLAKELEQFKPHIRTADARVHAVALGQAPPAMPAAEPEKPNEFRPAEEEQKSFKLRDGFESNLFVSEADGFVKPTQMVWDARGRLWATCAPSYPQVVPGVTANDYILVCEDTDHDGRADKFFKFAEGLTMPTGLCLGDGGVYLCEGTQLVHLKDTNGDEKADARRVVLSGFGTGDSHQCINSITWGPDGNLWFSQGLHIYSLVETPWGLSRCHKTGIWRFNPRTGRLDNFLGNEAASQNAWGVNWDDWGQTFYTPGNEPGCFYIDPALIRVPFETLAAGQYRSVGRLAVTGTKGMRTEFIGSSHLPDDLQGVYIKSVYIAGLCELHKFKDDGAGFASDDLGRLIESPLNVFRPIETKVGPDGALYVCDWYNPIIGHYQASYRDPARDHVHGRVWRLTAKGRPLVKWPKLAEMTSAQLLEQLASPERLIREQAKLLLYERPTNEVIEAADAFVGTGGPPVPAARTDDPSRESRLLYELIGVYAAHETVRPELIHKMLASPDFRVRAFATHMLCHWGERLENPLSLLRTAAADEHPRVRLEAVVACSYIPSPESIEVATLALGRPHDRFIDYALAQAVRALKSQWYPALTSGKLRFDGDAARLKFVLESDGTKDVAGLIRQLSTDAQLDADARARVLALLVTVGSNDDLLYAFNHAGESPLVLDELTSAARGRKAKPEGDYSQRLRELMSSDDRALRAAAIRVAGAWQVKAVAPEVRKLLASADDANVKLSAIGATAQLEGREALAILTPLAAKDQPAPTRGAAIAAIASIDVPAAAKLAAQAVAGVQNEEEARLVLAPLVNQRGGSSALAEQLAAAELPPDAAKLAHRALSAAGIGDAELVGALNKKIGIAGSTPAYSADVVASIVASAVNDGNADRGREMYLSKIANCTACHKLDGVGGDVGPDLSNIGKSLTPELIVEQVLWPDRQIKEGYLAVRAITDDGHVYTGLVVTESPTEIVLRDPAAPKPLRLSKARLEDLKPAGTLMPQNLTVGMTSEEVRDLVRYLSERGKR